MRGANFWSQRFPLLLQVNITFKKELDFDLIDKGLLAHFAKIELLKTLNKEKNLPAVVAQMAIILQQNAGIEVGFWTTKSTSIENTLNIIFEYKDAEAAEIAIESSIEILQSFSDQKESAIGHKIDKIKEKYLANLPSDSIQQLLIKAKTNNTPIITAKGNKPFQLGYGIKGIDAKDSNLKTINALLSDQHKWRIPIIAVTGSNGKTTTTRLIAHVLAKANYTVGFTTSDGIYINNDMIDHGDTTGPASAEMVLRNHEVDAAVLETARGGILRAGLGFDQCDIAVITNIQEDHLGISDIETMEDLAQVKAVVVGALQNKGTAVLNANNIYTQQIGIKANCPVAWFSLNKEVPFFETLINKAENTIAYVDNGMVILEKNGIKTEISHVKNIPITFNGTAKFMVENVLAAVLALSVFGIDAATITSSLRSFLPSVEQTPGRMNLFEINDKKLLVDFAHNPDGFAGIRDFLKTIESPQKIGIIVGTGDRKDSDTIELGQIAAEMFDVVLIHQVKFLRGQTAERIVDLLVQGILSINPNANWQRIPDDTEPLDYALSIAIPNAFITSLSDVIEHPAVLVEQYKQNS